MVSVTIGLTDPRLLKWFNEIDATLRKAEEGYRNASTIEESKRHAGLNEGELIHPGKVFGGKYISTPGAVKLYKETNSYLIAVLQSVIKEIQGTSAFVEDGKRWTRRSILAYTTRKGQ